MRLAALPPAAPASAQAADRRAALAPLPQGWGDVSIPVVGPMRGTPAVAHGEGLLAAAQDPASVASREGTSASRSRGGARAGRLGATDLAGRAAAWAPEASADRAARAAGGRGRHP